MKTRAEPARVLLVETNEDSTVGGSHEALLDLACALDPRVWQPVALFYRDNPFAARLQAAGVEVHVFEPVRRTERCVYERAGRVRRHLEALLAIRRRERFLRERRIDCVHVVNSPLLGCDDWAPAAKLLGIPCVASEMGGLHGADGALRRRLLRLFDLVLPVSECMAQGIRRLGYPERRIVVVRHGVDAEALRRRVRRPPVSVRRELGVPAGSTLVLMVANVRFWKGQHVLLAALERLPRELRGKLRVVFAGGVAAGDEEYRRSLSDRVSASGLGEVVRFLGYREDVPELLAAADIVVHASLLPEPGGIAVMEAMALGKAIVAACRGGHAELLRGDAGILHDPEEPEQLAAALERLVENADHRRQLGIRARAAVAPFTVERYARETERAYERVVRGRPSPRGGRAEAPVTLEPACR